MEPSSRPRDHDEDALGRDVVAGGSLVREDVAPYTVVAGRPAKVVKTIARPDAAAPPDAPDPTTPQAPAESP